MSTTTGDNAFLHELELDVRAELTLAQSGWPVDQAVASPAEEERLFDQVNGERYEVGLRDLLGAVQTLEDDSVPSIRPADTDSDETSGR